MTLRKLLDRLVLAPLVVGVILAACGSASTPTASTSEAGGVPSVEPPATSSAGAFPLSGAANTLTAAGATFPYPLYSRWFDVYSQKYGTKVNYQAIGSGGGIEQFTAGTVDFGATDAPMADEDIQKAGGDVLHIPMTLGAVAVTYNLPSLQQPLHLTGDVVAQIFLGTIKKWNDPKIAALNSGVSLPDTDIAVVHRSDSSGTTYIFTNWLSSQSQDWKSKVGADKDVQWPSGIGAKGNDGVAAQLKQVPGSIGYNEIAYALQNKLQFAAIKSPSGQFVTPELPNITAAASGAQIPADLRASILNAPGARAYPISSFTWIIVHAHMKDAAKARAIVNVLWWGIHDGQSYSEALGYAKLPQSVVQKDEAQLRKVEVNGQPLLR